MKRTIAVMAALLALPTLLPGAAGAASFQAQAVGSILVDAAGHATGVNLAADIHGDAGEIDGFSSLGRVLFDSVRVEGFSQAEALQGVGSSHILLRGANADVSIQDDAQTLLLVQAKDDPITVRYHLPDGVRAIGSDAASTIDIEADGAYAGSLVAVGGEARVHSITQDIQARLRPGSTLAFIARPSYAPEPYARALAAALGAGELRATYVTALHGGVIAASQATFRGSTLEATSSDGAVRAHLAAARGPSTVAFDLAYESLAARAADDVAVFIDGEPVARAFSPAEARAIIASGLPSWTAVATEGRVLVLAGAPEGDHAFSLSTAGAAPTEAQASAERRSAGEARVYGDVTDEGGKLLGAFLSGFVPEGAARIEGYTALASQLEVFRSIELGPDASGSLREAGDHILQLNSPRADITIVDDAYATLLVDGRSAGPVAFQLADGLRARPESAHVVAIMDASGPVGRLIATPADASPLAVDAQGGVRATLDEGGRIVFRAEPGFASDAALADAIAKGSVAGQILAGRQDATLARSVVAYVHGFDASVKGDAGRSIRIHALQPSKLASAFAVDIRGGAIPVKSAKDVRVLVGGEPATDAGSIEAALVHSSLAKYAAQTGPDGSLRVVIEGAAGRDVVIASALDESARAARDTDAFGAFRVFDDGTARGNFVTLRADQASGALSDVGLLADARPIFASLTAGHSAFGSRGLDGATTLVLENRESRIEIADATSGLLTITAKDDGADAVFRLASGEQPIARSPRVIEVLDAAGTHVGSFVLTGGHASADAATGVVRAHLPAAAEAIWRAHVGVESELSQAQRRMVNDAIASGRIAGQVFVQGPDALELASLGEHAASSTVTAAYSDVHMVTAATRGRIDVTVSSATSTGRTLLLTLDPQALPALAEGRATVLFDGAPAREADSYADVLDASDDDGAAEYLVLAGDAGTQVLVSIPHFSVHTVTLEQSSIPASGPIYEWSTAILMVVVVLEGILLIRRKQKKNRNDP